MEGPLPDRGAGPLPSRGQRHGGGGALPNGAASAPLKSLLILLLELCQFLDWRQVLHESRVTAQTVHHLCLQVQQLLSVVSVFLPREHNPSLWIITCKSSSEYPRLKVVPEGESFSPRPRAISPSPWTGPAAPPRYRILSCRSESSARRWRPLQAHCEACWECAGRAWILDYTPPHALRPTEVSGWVGRCQWLGGQTSVDGWTDVSRWVDRRQWMGGQMLVDGWTDIPWVWMACWSTQICDGWRGCRQSGGHWGLGACRNHWPAVAYRLIDTCPADSSIPDRENQHSVTVSQTVMLSISWPAVHQPIADRSNPETHLTFMLHMHYNLILQMEGKGVHHVSCVSILRAKLHV